ncbi:MAG: transposase, partial [Luteimonas sp.]
MRRPRLELPGIPMHITHRGVNRAATFIEDDDFAAYLQALELTAGEQRVAIHGYVLMTNHVHLLVSALEVGAVSRMMQALGRRYVRAFNAKYGRTGTLWEGRYKSCLVDSDRYLLTCLRYIELNPVRAAMVASPSDYRWSSVHMHVGTHCDSRVSPHPAWLALGSNQDVRCRAYQQLMQEVLTDDVIADIRVH